ncbi:MAG: ATP-binding protein [Bacteroidota bacterium]|nr:ATP-binding protein [Bacteroidota bacterium]
MFNLILGANNVGKTSLLEAIFLLTGPTNIQLPSVVQSARQLDAQSIETLESLFRNLNTRSTIELSATMRRGGGTRWLKISADSANGGAVKRSDSTLIGRHSNGDGERGRILPRQYQPLSSKVAGSRTIYYDAQVAALNGGDPSSIKGELEWMPNEGIRFSAPSADSESLLIPAAFISAQANSSGEAVQEILINKLDQELLEVLRQISPDIDRMAVVGQTVYVDIGLKKMMPLKTLGNGLVRAAHLYSTALSGAIHIMLIDEIENGLHHEGVECLLEALLSISGKRNIQFFATAHSLDVLIRLQSLLQRDGLLPIREDVRCFVLAKNRHGKVIAYNYDHEQFDHCVQHRIEIR